MLLPIPLLLSWFIGLVSLGLFALSIALLYRAAHRVTHYGRYRLATDARDTEEPARQRASRADVWWREPGVLAPLLGGLALLLLTFAGRYFVSLAFPAGPDEPSMVRGGIAKETTSPDGTSIHAEIYGDANAPTLVLTHGWGTNSTEWYYAKRDLAGRFRLIVWDIPGLGESPQPADRNFTLERMAAELHSVLALAGGKPVVLVGHSIGGMINLTFCRLYPESLGSQVTGIVEVDTSYTNPVKTTKNSGLSLALQKPVGEPVLHVMIWLSPLVRMMNWMSYQNGTAQMLNAQSSFAGSETRGQIDLVSRYQVEASQAVVARGTLGMFHWDATPVLPRVNVPVLILVGQQDTTTLPSASEYMHGTIPNSELQVVSPSAHYGLLEQNKRYDEAIGQFASAHLKP